MIAIAALLAALLALPAAAAPSGCREGFRRLDPAVRVDLSKARSADVEAVADYAQCLAVARRDVRACDMLESYAYDPSAGFTRDPRAACAEHAAQQLFARSALETGPRGGADCRSVVSVAGLASDARAGEVCALVAAKPRRPKDLCDRIAALAGRPLDGCAGLFQALDGGGPDVCASARNPHEAARCLDFVVFASAWKSADAKTCGDSLVCRLLLQGRPSLCAGLARKAAAAACPRT